MHDLYPYSKCMQIMRPKQPATFCNYTFGDCSMLQYWLSFTLTYIYFSTINGDWSLYEINRGLLQFSSTCKGTGGPLPAGCGRGKCGVKLNNYILSGGISLILNFYFNSFDWQKNPKNCEVTGVSFIWKSLLLLKLLQLRKQNRLRTDWWSSENKEMSYWQTKRLLLLH